MSDRDDRQADFLALASPPHPDITLADLEAFAAEREVIEPGDYRYPTDNEWDIPMLDVRKQARAVELPFTLWGAHGSRKRIMPGTYHFYTQDYRFSALWQNPLPLVESGCAAVVEPNFSVYAQMAFAEGLHRIYQKRWLARYWQANGVRVFVDLNVGAKFAHLNLLGVPVSWRAYATRGYEEQLDATCNEFETACERAGTDDVLFIVYGGGDAVRRECMTRAWVWFPEDRDCAKGRVFHG